MPYAADSSRYSDMLYKRAGKSGIKLPAISLGLWQNFGGNQPLENSRAMLLKAFDLGINHFDLANNYGPPAVLLKKRSELYIRRIWLPIAMSF